MNITDAFSSAIMFFTWRDAIEVIFFSTLIYAISLWLKKDIQKNLLGYFYLYCLMFFIAYQTRLTAITYTLVIGAPICAMLFILMHQRTLQKNLIALRSITPAKQDTNTWLETLVQVCLARLDNEQEIMCIIEHQEHLESLLTTPLALHANIQKELLEILIASPSFNKNGMLWLNARGKMLGINATWKNPHNDELSSENHDYHAWKTAALFFTAATDAIILRSVPATRTFTIIMQGAIHEQLRAPATLALIKSSLQKQPALKQGDFHVKPTIKHNEHQQRSN